MLREWMYWQSFVGWYLFLMQMYVVYSLFCTQHIWRGCKTFLSQQRVWQYCFRCYNNVLVVGFSQTSNANRQIQYNYCTWRFWFCALQSIVTIGAAVGGLLGGWLVDKIGRKLSLMFCSLPFVFGFTVIIAAQDIWMLYLGRALTGLASGVTSLVVPVSKLSFWKDWHTYRHTKGRIDKIICRSLLKKFIIWGWNFCKNRRDLRHALV